jgi:hypothetical protein
LALPLLRDADEGRHAKAVKRLFGGIGLEASGKLCAALCRNCALFRWVRRHFCRIRPESLALNGGILLAEGFGGRGCSMTDVGSWNAPVDGEWRVRKGKTDMPVLAKFGGIVIRMLIDRTFGTHFHAFYGDCELVIALNPLRVIQGDSPAWVKEWALEWVKYHESHDPLRCLTPREFQW